MRTTRARVRPRRARLLAARTAPVPFPAPPSAHASTTHPPTSAAPARPPLVRPRADRILGGVASGVAAHLGVPVRLVRIAFILLVGASGAGIGAYLFLWALTPNEDDERAGAVPADVPGASDDVVARRAAGTRDLVVGGLLLAVGLVLAGSRLGLPVNSRFVVPAAVVLGGAGLAWSQLDEVQRARFADRSGLSARGALWRTVGGLVLVATGVLLIVIRTTDLESVSRALAASLAVLAGVALVLAPWGLRLWRDLDAERAERVRQAERADIAAHLHDSVLQTLSLIQRSSTEPGQVARLARAQERDLRAYLYGDRKVSGESLAAAVRELAADVEDLHSVPVEVVVVGDRPVDGRAAVLLASLREAMVNAVRHAGPPVSVYVECGPAGVEAFVRDRGPGFEIGDVPADRLGVRESILGRMTRHGGSAKVRRAPGQGTEVELVMPDEAPEDLPDAPARQDQEA